MSGHSKWSTIKHRKGAQDAKRAKVFSRIAKMIIVAAQQGGSDPETNSSLKMLLDQARKVNMPKDNIERAIKRGTGEGGEGRLEEVVYEAMGPEGTMMIITCATDNTNRSITDVKTALKKNNGKFVPSGSVSFQFQHLGHIVITPEDFDEAELAAIDAGAVDVFHEGESLTIYTELADFHSVREALVEQGYEPTHAELTYKPTQTVSLSEAGMASYEALYDIIEDLDDVQTIYDNVA